MAASLDETRMEQDRGRPHCFSLFLRFPGSLAPWPEVWDITVQPSGWFLSSHLPGCVNEK